MITKMAFLAHPTRDIERAKSFFAETLGLECTAEYGTGWCEFRTPDGTTLALDAYSPQFDDKAGVFMALETDDIAAEVERLRAAGIEVVKDAWTNAEPDGSEICKMAILKDPDGNPFMLHEIAPHRA